MAIRLWWSLASSRERTRRASTLKRGGRALSCNFWIRLASIVVLVCLARKPCQSATCLMGCLEQLLLGNDAVRFVDAHSHPLYFPSHVSWHRAAMATARRLMVHVASTGSGYYNGIGMAWVGLAAKTQTSFDALNDFLAGTGRQKTADHFYVCHGLRGMARGHCAWTHLHTSSTSPT